MVEKAAPEKPSESVTQRVASAVKGRGSEQKKLVVDLGQVRPVSLDGTVSGEPQRLVNGTRQGAMVSSVTASLYPLSEATGAVSRSPTGAKRPPAGSSPHHRRCRGGGGFTHQRKREPRWPRTCPPSVLVDEADPMTAKWGRRFELDELRALQLRRRPGSSSGPNSIGQCRHEPRGTSSTSKSGAPSPPGPRAQRHHTADRLSAPR